MSHIRQQKVRQRQPAVSDEVARLTAELVEAQLSVARLQRIIDVVPVGIVRYGRGGDLDFINRRVLTSTGAKDGAEFSAISDLIIHPDDAEGHRQAWAIAASGTLAHFQMRVKNAADEWMHVDGSLMPTFSNGERDSMIVIFRDVTHQVAQNRAVQRFKAIAEATTDIVGIADLAGEVVYLNPAGREFMGLGDAHPRDLYRFFDYIPSEYHTLLMDQAFVMVKNGGVWQGDVELLRGVDSVRCPMSAVVMGIHGDNGELVGIAVTYRDLTDRKRMVAELAYSAAHDPLTGLANRQQLFRSLESSLTSGSPTALLFFDLDDFKVVNDSLGHAAGDAVLCTLAERIRNSARSTDLVGRLGGDEFLVICRNVSTAHQAMTIANHVLDAVKVPMEVGARPHFVTGSIGIALSGQRQTTAARLVQEADIAMYRAKRAGRSRVVLYDESMRVEAIDRLELHRELRLALEHDEFELYFQPLVHFGRASVLDFEALIRWNHPRHGLLSPAEFLPVVEQVGLTATVGQWVFGAATRAVAAMRLIEPKTRVGVNVHPDQIRQVGFVDGVTRSLLAARITGEALAIEITEHAVMVDVDTTRLVLEELRAIGVSVAIDDFGTGYSNLDLLRRLPVDFLKIDRSFVTGLGVEPGDTQLVRMILGLSQELGITVVAEGIETQLQASELQRLGCTIGQGYLYAAPMPFDDAIALLHGQQAKPPSSDMIVPVM